MAQKVKTEQIQSSLAAQMKNEEIFNELFNTFLGDESIVSWTKIHFLNVKY
jgi:hypothetical protein